MIIDDRNFKQMIVYIVYVCVCVCGWVLVWVCAWVCDCVGMCLKLNINQLTLVVILQNDREWRMKNLSSLFAYLIDSSKKGADMSMLST